MKIDRNIPVLIDFDGILRLGDKIAGDANALLKFLEEEKIPSYIISNSTMSSSEDIKNFLLQNGAKTSIKAMTTIDASVNFLKENKLKASVYCSGNIKKLFKDFSEDENPDCVLIGDMGSEWSYDILNEIFRKVRSGAEILAMQKNKYWKPDGKTPALDAGAFISAIEYSSSKKALLIGKPSPLYFQSALNKLGFYNGNKFIMVGDDLETDIKGSQEINGVGILVFTGKTKFPLKSQSSVSPDFTANNLSEVTKLLKKILNVK